MTLAKAEDRQSVVVSFMPLRADRLGPQVSLQWVESVMPEKVPSAVLLMTANIEGEAAGWLIRHEDWPDDLDWPPEVGDVLTIILPWLISAERPEKGKEK